MKGKISLVTGGARSGKSGYAEKLAKGSTQPVAYIATAISFDEGMEDRIKKHRQSRPKEWITFEGYKDLHTMIPTIAKDHGTVLLDCVTIMVTNLMFENQEMDWDRISREDIDALEESIKKQITNLLGCVRDHDLWMIMVTNEVGMGIVPDTRLSRIFRDIAGRVNQMIAWDADEVYFTVSGIPMKIK